MKTQHGGGGLAGMIRGPVWLLVVAWLAAGCASTFKEVKPVTTGEAPRQRPVALTVGKISVSEARGWKVG